jgi:anti-anti-sigma factor
MDRVIGREDRGDVVLDLRSLSFMDSSGVKVIIEAAQRLGPRRSIVLRHPAGEVRRLIDVTGLERLPSISVETS